MRPIHFGLVLVPLIAAPALAFADPPVDPDLMTVSGRAALPMADGTPLAARLELGALAVDPAVPKLMHVDGVSLPHALTQALDKSLKNYDYRWSDAPTPGPAVDPAQAAAPALPQPAPATVNVAVLPLEVTPDAAGERVVARLSATSADAGACFPYEAKGEFRALTPLHSGGGQKALAILVVVASAAAGVNASALAVDQFNSADAQQAALNSRRVVGADEGVAPQGGDEAVVRYGGVNALHLAVTDLIAHLGEPGGCNRPPAAPALATTLTPTVVLVSTTAPAAAPDSAGGKLPPPAAAATIAPAQPALALP
jgi:hypothetical protein